MKIKYIVKGCRMLQSVNPANLQTIKTYLQMQPSEVNRILDLTNSAFEEWKDTSFDYRSRLMMKAADVLQINKDEYSNNSWINWFFLCKGGFNGQTCSR